MYAGMRRMDQTGGGSELFLRNEYKTIHYPPGGGWDFRLERYKEEAVA
jgi:hypothetical protein